MEDDDADKENELLSQSQALPAPDKPEESKTSPVFTHSGNPDLDQPENGQYSAWSTKQETLSSKLSKLQVAEKITKLKWNGAAVVLKRRQCKLLNS